MTSSGATPPVANIVWDKSGLHSDRALRRHQALHPAPSAADHARRHHHHHHHHHHRTPTPTSTTLPPPGRPGARPGESDLRMSFDPMKDLHMWTMWRVAVNGRIVDETRRRNRAQPAEGGDFDPNPYGRALVKTPLDRFIRVGQGSQKAAGAWMDPHGQGGDRLGTQQFVYYGVPRVVLKKAKPKVEYLPN